MDEATKQEVLERFRQLQDVQSQLIRQVGLADVQGRQAEAARLRQRWQQLDKLWAEYNLLWCQADSQLLTQQLERFQQNYSAFLGSVECV